MGQTQVLLLLFCLVSGLFAATLFSGRRRAIDVLVDLAEGPQTLGRSRLRAARPGRVRRYWLAATGAIGVGSGVFVFSGGLGIGVVSAALALALLQLIAEARVRSRKRRQVRELEFHLPVVMERVVMAVQSGLDVIPALKRVVEIERDQQRCGRRKSIDPVSALLERVVTLSESGAQFSDALGEVASMTPCPAIRHALIHLGVAVREGGELVMPLKELSDSTQLYYQESVEEQIAKMPVKATLPLLLTFTGLILCFLTSPLLQVVRISSKAMP